ncbi:thiamine phosphate synthase [Elizabethkingia argentiflava]|uniref:Thiamine phosphate synthase n=1 Tax=Elizabethkingia argenteiflava TaxID=2681556 RepID=A0A845PTB3_9FLAO|nr:thiamine phosphate synthase [Elizabethkingia argenteiflava]NAW50166.1 thiamine phosphate synthase [Elizabethkingia argenteiflava]
MMIVIAPEKAVKQELYWVNTLLENGLSCFHVRKYAWSEQEIRDYIEGIDSQYHSHLVLHSHYFMAKDFGINRLHFREIERKDGQHIDYKDSHYRLSTSTHSIHDFNKLGQEWTYAFFSPVFASISKEGYGGTGNVLSDLPLKNNKYVQLIGLGGITQNNMIEVLSAGADGVAFLGGIWQSESPVETFVECQKKWKHNLYNKEIKKC